MKLDRGGGAERSTASHAPKTPPTACMTWERCSSPSPIALAAAMQSTVKQAQNSKAVRSVRHSTKHDSLPLTSNSLGNYKL